MKPPVARKREKKITIHGHSRVDPYYWMKERDNPEVISYLEQENAYARSRIDPDLENRLFDEIIGRIKQEDRSAPSEDQR